MATHIIVYERIQIWWLISNWFPKLSQLNSDQLCLRVLLLSIFIKDVKWVLSSLLRLQIFVVFTFISHLFFLLNNYLYNNFISFAHFSLECLPFAYLIGVPSIIKFSCTCGCISEVFILFMSIPVTIPQYHSYVIMVNLMLCSFAVT